MPLLSPACPFCAAPLELGLERCPACGMVGPPPAVGDVIGGCYRLLRVLGQGGMGCVLLATDLGFDRPVAIKTILPAVVHDPELIERFRREGLALARLRQENLPQVHAFGFAGAYPYLVLEYVAGSSIRDWLRGAAAEGRPLPVDRVAAVLAQICLALDAVHRAGMIHRDVKPANVLVEPSGRAVLVDFGIVRAAGLTGLTAPGQTLCTAEYASPEQLEGRLPDPPEGCRSDLYSLAATAYELFTGRTVFLARSWGEMVVRQVVALPEPPSRFRPDLPPGLDALLLRALAKSSADRPVSALAFREELLQCCPGARSSSGPPSWPGRAALAQAPTWPPADEVAHGGAPDDLGEAVVPGGADFPRASSGGGAASASLPGTRTNRTGILALAVGAGVLLLLGLIGWRIGLFGESQELPAGPEQTVIDAGRPEPRVATPPPHQESDAGRLGAAAEVPRPVASNPAAGPSRPPRNPVARTTPASSGASPPPITPRPAAQPPPQPSPYPATEAH